MDSSSLKVIFLFSLFLSQLFMQEKAVFQSVNQTKYLNSSN